MLREHRGFSSFLVLEPPQSTARTFADVLQLPVRLRACCEQDLGTKRLRLGEQAEEADRDQ
jgi:hypothetical protein